MAIRLQDENDPGEWVFWKNDPETKKPIRLKVRRPEPGFYRRSLKAAMKNLRVEQWKAQPASSNVDRSAEVTLRTACHVLLDSENFEVVANQALREALGDAKAGEVVCLDGKWNATVKELVLSHAEPLISWLCEKSNDLLGMDADDEEAAAESFR
jgi:hypothetical protein